MRLAITGATGFVGSAVIDCAIAQGHECRALTRKDQGARDRVEWIKGTLSDDTALLRLIDGCDALIHVAGLTNTPDPTEFETANVAGTAAMIAAAKQAKVKRFVFVSSLSAREPELSAYGASKARAETLVQESGRDWTIVRPPAVYGPRDDDMFELFRSAQFGLVPLPPKGATSIIHVDDLARLLIALAGKSALKSIYEPDDGQVGGYSHKELGKAIGRAVGRRSVLAVNLPKEVLKLAAKGDKLLRGEKAKLTADRVGYMLHPNWVSRFDRAVPANVWQPQIGGEDGLSKTAQWYEKEGWL
ncbi:MAG: NAD(P)-dependent oxidoreductase [Erythrobacter sp.]